MRTSFIASDAILDRRKKESTDRICVSALSCPSCKSDQLRRSRRRADDGVRRRLFCTAYRCVLCQERSFRLSTGRLLGAAVAAALVMTIALTVAWPAAYG